MSISASIEENKKTTQIMLGFLAEKRMMGEKEKDRMRKMRYRRKKKAGKT